MLFGVRLGSVLWLAVFPTYLFVLSGVNDYLVFICFFNFPWAQLGNPKSSATFLTCLKTLNYIGCEWISPSWISLSHTCVVNPAWVCLLSLGTAVFLQVSLITPWHVLSALCWMLNVLFPTVCLPFLVTPSSLSTSGFSCLTNWVGCQFLKTCMSQSCPAPLQCSG